MRTFYNLKKSSTKIDFDIWPIFLKNPNGGVLRSGKIDDENFPFLFRITKMYAPVDKKIDIKIALG